MKLTRIAVVATLAVAVPTMSLPDEPLPSELYETATVRARPVANATASVTVLDREEIEAIDVVSVAELIRFVPGLDVTSSGPRGGFATAQIRAGDPNFTVVMLDGIPLNDITDSFGGAVNLNSLSTSLVERIEVVRGPVSSVFGSTGLAGAVNIITRRGGEVGYQVDAAAGEDSILQTAASVFGGGDRVDYFFGATWDEEEDRVVEDSFEQLGVNGNATLRLGGGGELRLTGRVTSWETEDYPEASGGPLLGDGETRDSEHDEVSLGATLEFGKSERRQRLYMTAYRHELDRDSPGVPFSFATFNFVPPSMEETTFNNVQVGWAMPGIRTGALQWAFGLEVDLEDGENDSLLMIPPSLGGPPDGSPTDGSYSVERYIGGAYFEVAGERGRFLWEIGGRVDWPEALSPEFSPRAGVSYRFANEATRLRGSVGRAFKLPSFTALASPAALGGNPDLDPEVSIGADLGIEHEFEGIRLKTGLTVFRNEFEDLVDFVFEPGVFGFVNQNEVNTYGAELTVDWQITGMLRFRGNATRQEWDTVGTSDVLRSRPEWVGGARVSIDPTDRLRIELDGQWTSSQFDEQIPVGADEIGGYGLFGAAVSYDITSRWQLRTRFDNVTDKSYQTQLGFPGPESTFRIGLRHRSGT
jgi:outer membrane cobalamin receptor